MATRPSRELLRRPRPGARRRRALLLHEAGELLRIAGPIIVSQLSGIGMMTMDTIMVGHLGAVELAAAGLASSLQVAFLTACTGTILGMGPLVSQAFGAGDERECRHVLSQGLWLALLLSVPLVVISRLGEPIALALGQPADVARLAGDYMDALAWGIVPLLLFTAFRQFLEGMGVVKPPMIIAFLGLAVNFVGNWIFIYGVEGWVPAFGVVGSGMATTTVRWAMLVAMVAFLLRHRELHPFRGGHLAPEGELFGHIVRIGVPSGLQMALEVGVFSLAAVMMGWFGATALAAQQVTINIAATTFMVALGVSLAGSIRVGHRIGARNLPAARRAALVTYGLAIGFMALCALCFLLIPELLIGLYTQDERIIALGVQLLFMAALFQIFDGAQAAGFNVLRGAADTRVPMVLAAVAYWVIGAPLAYLLGFHTPLRESGIWAGLCVSLAVAALLLVARLRTVLWSPGPASAGPIRSLASPAQPPL